MSSGRRIIQQGIRNIQDKTEAFPGVPVVEIAGDSRVLIENHLGIVEYGYDKITVKMNYGRLCVCGNQLSLAQMTKQQLVILGMIHSVSIIRGTKK